MNHLDDDDNVHPHRDHELTLSTPAILGLLFGLVVLCGLFFGMGYMVRGGRPQPVLVQNAEPAPSNANFNSFKPAAGSPAHVSSAAAASPDTPAEATPTDEPAPSTHAVPAPEHPAAVPAPVAQAPAGTIVVQVAAISVAHPEDADLLVNALRAKGYAVTSHPEADHFLHIQVGPFAVRKDAEAMRSRLQADGYNPYIK